MRWSRTKRRGYICIWGTTNREKTTDQEGVVMDCPGCGQKSHMIGKAMTPYCSVFYIPLFPEGKGQPFLECTRCGGKYNGDAAEIRAHQQDFQTELDEAIAEKSRLYRANPADVDLGCELVELLAQADRSDDALKLALYLTESHAENANAHVVLGRIHLHRDEPGKALEPLRQAIARNPAHAGAHFYSAVALLNTIPPQYDQALESARQARDCGHPKARDLIQAIEQDRRN
jgi:tetratricopeptide (TPR) repeat protein